MDYYQDNTYKCFLDGVGIVDLDLDDYEGGDDIIVYEIDFHVGREIYIVESIKDLNLGH